MGIFTIVTVGVGVTADGPPVVVSLVLLPCTCGGCTINIVV